MPLYDQEEMPPRIDKLLQELKLWCDEHHGRKAEVARFLGLPRQAVSNWFGSRERYPTAEQALAIQEFLAQKRRERRK
jgi:hypothetical protein